MGLGCSPFVVGHLLVAGGKCCSRDFGLVIDNIQQIQPELTTCGGVSCAQRDLQELTSV